MNKFKIIWPYNFNTKTFEEVNILTGNSRPRLRTIVIVKVVSRYGVSSHVSDMLCIPTVIVGEWWY
jgi:hypothetical protein